MEILDNKEIECEVEKRRRCDSAYITLYKKLMKEHIKLKNELEDYKKLCNIYKQILDETIDNMKGGEINERSRCDLIK